MKVILSITKDGIEIGDARTVRDFQQSKVYRAERVIDVGSTAREPEFPTVADCERFVAKVLGSRTFVRRWGNGRRIAIEDGRGRRSACAWGDSIAASVISLPRWARTRASILHEIAHTIVHDGHGPLFARTYLELVRLFIGPMEANALRKSFQHNRVRVASPAIYDVKYAARVRSRAEQ